MNSHSSILIFIREAVHQDLPFPRLRLIFLLSGVYSLLQSPLDCFAVNTVSSRQSPQELVMDHVL